MNRTFYLISYDIPDNKRRLKIAHLLEGYGERVQYSVFEVWATPQELEKLQKRLEPLVKARPVAGETPETPGGSVRIYALCATCRDKRVVLGQGTPTAEPGLQVL